MTLASWKSVEAEMARMAGKDHPALLGRANPEAFVWSAPHLEADVIKAYIDETSLAAMQAVAAERGLKDKIRSLFAGEIVNVSEHRPALHWALRGNGKGIPAADAMTREAEKAAAFATKAASGGLGFTVKTILHIGIGGSDLGPRLIWDALRDYASNGPQIRFVANVDPEDFAEQTAGLDAKTTLVLVVSKSFKTPETASNAQLGREWLVKQLGEAEANNHLAAVSSAPDKAKAWGAAEDRIFPMDESVGGRYSVWSSVGLSLQIALGADVWNRFLKGAAEMDRHFRDTPLENNLPAKLAMLDVFRHSGENGAQTRTVLAYAHRLRKLPDFLQQLEMESNGKNVSDAPGGLIAPTAPIVWGSVGTLGQHSFHQLLHQGMRETAIEFVAALDAGAGDKTRGRALLANAFAQAEGLLGGRGQAAAEKELLAKGMDPAKAKEQSRHMVMHGGRGSTTILLDNLSPESVGALIALYEHRTFAAGILWGINPFDQWGVELGKVLAEQLDKAIAGEDPGKRDPSTLRLVSRARKTVG
ncbi:MAG TPA: glucose-6-phosphate isomerase [Hyphomonadaceae bacterium]|nr:glucose-6-phosphate isomerase [Hyphomonadaceae bacterium]HPI50302.1 glucose-6-phosphate isomerase [Hyphomonadaceae bacterium]